MSWAVLHALARHGGRVEVKGEVVESTDWVSFTTGDGKFRVAIASRRSDFTLKEVEFDPTSHQLVIRDNAIQYGIVTKKRSPNPLFERIVAFNYCADFPVKVCAIHHLDVEGRMKTSTVVQRSDVPFARQLELEDEDTIKMRMIANIGLEGIVVRCRKVD